jgi:Trm5-related predicted tRNA methylase
MDKTRLVKIITSANVEVVTIPSTANRQDRDRLVKDFVKKADRVHDGEVVLVIVLT